MFTAIFEPHSSWLLNFLAALLGIGLVVAFLAACAAMVAVLAGMIYDLAAMTREERGRHYARR